MKRLFILGDLLFTNSEQHLIEKKDYTSLLGGELEALLLDKDNHFVINLEGPITDSGVTQRKGGSPNLKSNYSVIDFINLFPNLLVSGANNHITDYGLKGINDTKQALESSNIPFIGFGSNLEELKKIHYETIEGNRICYLSIAQNEFCTMDSFEKYYGATPYDALDSFDTIKEAKSKADYLIVLFHSGKENYRYPTPDQTRICRKMVDAGADLIVCQHSHCVGCKEIYKKSTIVYGTGNFIFNISDNVLWKTSIVPCLTITGSGVLEITFIPLEKTSTGIAVAKGDQADKILFDFNTRTKEIESPGFIKRTWEQYCEDNKYVILWNAFFRYPRIVYIIDRITGRLISKRLLRNWKKTLTTYNYIRCEAINEMCRTIFESNEKHND